MPSGHSNKEKAARRESFIPPGTPLHACGSLNVSQPSSEGGGEVVPAWGRGSSCSSSLPGPPLTTGGGTYHQVPSPAEPHSQEDVHQAGHTPLDAHQGLSLFSLQWIQERKKSRVMYFVRLIFKSLFIPHFVLLAYISKYKMQSITIIFSIKFQENEMITRP